MDDGIRSIEYGALGQFEVIDPALVSQAGGGLYIAVGVFSDTEINNGCVKDIQNNACVSPNAFCASDTACAEIV